MFANLDGKFLCDLDYEAEEFMSGMLCDCIGNWVK
jgi:hypothetical protein